MLGKHKVDTIRQRKGSKNKSKDDEPVEPLDQDDQARLIQQLRAENTQQQASIERVFGYLCITAAVVLVLSVLYLDQWHLAKVAKRSVVVDSQYLPALRALSVSHGVSSALLHATTPRLTQPRQAVGLVFQTAVVVDMGMAASVLWACRSWTDKNDETLLWMHYGILASNAFVVLAAVLLRWDAASTDKAFADLIQAQYRFKSL